MAIFRGVMEVVKSKHQGRQYGTNFTLGDDKTPLVSSYYKDYIESKRRTTEGADSVKQVLAKPPQCARVRLIVLGAILHRFC